MRRISLGLKLAAVVAIAVVVVTASVAVAFQRSAERHFQGYLNQAMMMRARLLLPDLASYYAQHGGWARTDEIEAIVTAGMGMPRGGGPLADAGFGRLVLTDRGGTVVAGDPNLQGRTIPERILNRSTSIMVNRQVVGHLVMSPGTRETDLVRALNRSLMWGGVLAAGIAIVLGFVVTHQMLRPLTDLSQAADSNSRTAGSDAARIFSRSAMLVSAESSQRGVRGSLALGHLT
ncbi:MAG: hypothetical protein ACP5G7_04890 [Anaerolineae bacterium]